MTDIYDAIADDTRRQILDSLRVKPGQSVGELVELTKLGQPTVSKHLKTLRDANLVSVKTVGQNRFYSVNAAGLAPVNAWLGSFKVSDASALEEQFGEIGEKVGAWLAAGSTWLGNKFAEQVKVDTDPQKLGRELGRKLADAKVEAEKAAKVVEKQTRTKVDAAVSQAASKAAAVKKTVASKVKR